MYACISISLNTCTLPAMYSIIALLPCVADPLWSFSLWVYTQPLESTLSLRALPLLVCANVILCRYLLGPFALLDLMVSLIPTSSKERVHLDHQVFQSRLIGESSAQRFTANSF